MPTFSTNISSCVPTESQVKKNQAIIAGVQGGGLGSKQLSLRHFRQDDFWFPAISRFS